MNPLSLESQQASIDRRGAHTAAPTVGVGNSGARQAHNGLQDAVTISGQGETLQQISQRFFGDHPAAGGTVGQLASRYYLSGHLSGEQFAAVAVQEIQHVDEGGAIGVSLQLLNDVQQELQEPVQTLAKPLQMLAQSMAVDSPEAVGHMAQLRELTDKMPMDFQHQNAAELENTEALITMADQLSKQQQQSPLVNRYLEVLKAV